MIFLIDVFLLLIFLLFFMDFLLLRLSESRLFPRGFFRQGLIFDFLDGHFIQLFDVDNSVGFLSFSGFHVIHEGLALVVLLGAHQSGVSLGSHVEERTGCLRNQRYASSFS